MARHAAISSTMCVMLLHALLGCCWHHSHASGNPGASTRATSHRDATTRLADRRPQGCRHAHPSQSNESRSHESDPAENENCPCQGERCTYVGSKAAARVNLQPPLSFDILPLVGPLNKIGASLLPDGGRRYADISTADRVRLRTEVWRL
jgi:hypothetical protein